jgi:hypothetical protein
MNVLSSTGLRELYTMKQMRFLNLTNIVGDNIDKTIAELLAAIPLLHVNQIISHAKAVHTARSLANNRPNETCVDLNNCTRLDFEGVGCLMSMNYLQTLNMSGCSGVTPTSIKMVAALLNLQSLVVSNTSVDDTSMSLVSGLPKLEHLNIVRCYAVTDNGLAALAESRSISSLYVGAGGFRRHVNPSLARAITDTGLKHIAQLAQLRKFNIIMCPEITEIGLKQFAGTVLIRVNGCVQITPAVAMSYNNRTPPY